MDLQKVDRKRLDFMPVKTLYFSANLTPLNELLAWKCRELKRVSMIHSIWSVKGMIRIRRTANEKALPIKNNIIILFNWYGFFICILKNL